MFLRNSHIKEPVRVHIPEALQSGTVRHGCRNSHYPFVPLAQLAHNSGKHIRIIGHGAGMGRNSRLDVKRLCPVESGGMFLRRSIALALLGNHMHQHSSLDSLRFLNDLDQAFDIMSVYRA